MSGGADGSCDRHDSCPSCGAHDAATFYRVDDVPVQSGLILSSRDEAVAIPRGEIRLGLCSPCGLISNTRFDPATQEHSARYEVAQGFSPSFSSFIGGLARDLIDRYDIRRKRVIEIGCGAGEFLNAICALGDNHGIGIDPASDPGRIVGERGVAGIEFIQDYWSDEYASLEADVICCRHTLEHIPSARAFVASVRRAVESRRDTIIVFEVPDATRVLEEGAFWDVYYEHCGYYLPTSIRRLFESCDLEVIALDRIFHEQYLLLTARARAGTSERQDNAESHDTERLVDRFRHTSGERIRKWRDHVKRIASEDRKAVIWGSGSKAVGFLTTLGATSAIECLVDINPHRHGQYSPGTGHRIVGPDALREIAPDEVIIMNPAYRDEIGQQLAALRVPAEILTM